MGRVRFGTRGWCGGPFHKLGEVIKKGDLDLVFGSARELRCRRHCEGEEASGDESLEHNS